MCTKYSTSAGLDLFEPGSVQLYLGIVSLMIVPDRYADIFGFLEHVTRHLKSGTLDCFRITARVQEAPAGTCFSDEQVLFRWGFRKHLFGGR